MRGKRKRVEHERERASPNIGDSQDIGLTARILARFILNSNRFRFGPRRIVRVISEPALPAIKGTTSRTAFPMTFLPSTFSMTSDS
jgi:hypothetical protein